MFWAFARTIQISGH